MKFVLAQTIRYWWPVTVSIPDTDNPGKLINQTLKVLFEAKSQDDAIADQRRIEAITDITTRLVEERELLVASVKGWDDVVDDDRNVIPFTEDVFRAALQQSWFRTGVYVALSESLSGQEARLGN